MDVLKEALQAFKGTLVLVSHEEDFLRAVTNATWAVAEDRVLSAAGFAPDLLAVEPEDEKPSDKPAAVAIQAKAEKASQPKGLSKNELFRMQKKKTEVDERVAALASEKAALERRFMAPDSVVTEDWRALHVRFEEVKRLLAAAEEEWLEVVGKLEEDG